MPEETSEGTPGSPAARAGGAAGVILGLIVVYFFTVAPHHLDRYLNPTVPEDAPDPSSEVQALHDQLFIADLHADSLLWPRDLLTRAAHGHLDVPRMVEGNVGLATFSAVTKVPWGQNYRSNRGNSDKIFWLVMAQRWPPSTWWSLAERTLYQSRRLHRAAHRSDGRLRIVTSRKDLRGHLDDRDGGSEAVAGLLAIEGLHALEGDIENLERFARAGYRMMGPAHFFDNRVGGSAHGVEKTGLTEFGRRVIDRMEQHGILVDLAHASPRTIEDVLALADRPVVVSHTGVKGTCEGHRNLTDGQLEGLARTGGVVGIGFWPGAVCGEDVDAIVKAIRYTVDEIGAEHVALGSDWDGTVLTPFDASGLSALTRGLIEDGFTRGEIRRIMGGNVRRLLLRTLPDGDPDTALSSFGS